MLLINGSIVNVYSFTGSNSNMFASTVKKESTPKGKNLLLKEQIHSFKPTQKGDDVYKRKQELMYINKTLISKRGRGFIRINTIVMLITSDAILKTVQMSKTLTFCRNFNFKFRIFLLL